MRNAIRSACLAILTLIVAGCGKKPQVPENTVAAAYIDIECIYENGKLLAETIIGEIPSNSVVKKEYDMVVAAINEYRTLLRPKWAVVAFGGTLADLSRAPSENISMAIRIDADEKTVDNTLKKLVEEKAGKKEVMPETRKNGVIYEVYSSFFAGRIGDDFLILANSRNAFMDMFNLYTGEAKPSTDFRELPRLSSHTIARISTVPIHSLISRLELKKAVERFGKVSDDEDLADMILNLGPATFDILADGEDIGLSLRIACGSTGDAKVLEHVFQTISFMSRTGFDVCAYLADNPGALPERFRDNRSWIRKSKSFFMAASRAFDAGRDGSIAELTFANSIAMIGKSIAKLFTPDASAGKTPPAPALH